MKQKFTAAVFAVLFVLASAAPALAKKPEPVFPPPIIWPVPVPSDPVLW